jgi:acetyl-CoA acetyltransferase
MKSTQANYRGVRFRDGAEGDSQFLLPYGAGSTFQYHALAYKRYMAKYDAKREHMAKLVVSQRNNANLNPYSAFYDKPLTIDDYMDARMIADPLCLYDCDMPSSGAGAMILTSAERARDLKQRPAYVAGYGENTARKKTGIVYQVEDYMNTNAIDNIWRMSGLGPHDVDVAQLYDGFSPSAMYWLEAAGFCKQGEGFQMIDSGAIELGGSLPVNTSGGQLSEGNLGLGKAIEAVRQVTGRAGRRQVHDAHASLVVEGSPMQKGAGVLFTDEP